MEGWKVRYPVNLLSRLNMDFSLSCFLVPYLEPHEVPLGITVMLPTQPEPRKRTSDDASHQNGNVVLPA